MKVAFIVCWVFLFSLSDQVKANQSTQQESYVQKVKEDREAIRQKIKEHIPEIRECYEKELRQKPELKGKIVVDFEVDSSGSAQKVSINEKKTQLKDPGVQACLIAHMKAWKFPPAPEGSVTVITYPFVFDKMK